MRKNIEISFIKNNKHMKNKLIMFIHNTKYVSYLATYL